MEDLGVHKPRHSGLCPLLQQGGSAREVAATPNVPEVLELACVRGSGIEAL